MRSHRKRWSVLFPALCSLAGICQNQLDSNRIISADIYMVQFGRSFRNETYLSCMLRDNSRLKERADYHLKVSELEGLATLEELASNYVNPKHLAAEQKENDIIYVIFEFTTPSGFVKRMYMTGETRYYYDGKWYENEQLTEVLFQYLKEPARPPK